VEPFPHSFFLENAEEITRLKARIDETFQHRGESQGLRAVWERACADFHSRFDLLAFPGGYQSAGARILDGDQAAIESALQFLEVRPYFFRSGYMRTALMRRLKRAVLTAPQAARLEEQVAARKVATKRRGSPANPPLQRTALARRR
jgi:hypothetical protein